MHHKLVIPPIPMDVLYVNELSLAGEALYETKQDMDKALTGRTKANGGIQIHRHIDSHIGVRENSTI